MATKVTIWLTCSVCGRHSTIRDYVGRWTKTIAYNHPEGRWEATQICSHECFDTRYPHHTLTVTEVAYFRH